MNPRENHFFKSLRRILFDFFDDIVFLAALQLSAATHIRNQTIRTELVAAILNFDVFSRALLDRTALMNIFP